MVLCAAYEVGKNALDIRGRDVQPDQVVIPVSMLIPAVADAFEQRAGIGIVGVDKFDAISVFWQERGAVVAVIAGHGDDGKAICSVIHGVLPFMRRTVFDRSGCCEN